MRIGNDSAISQTFNQMTIQDPFDLNLQVTELKIERQDGEQVTSKSICTPTCGNQGTGNSFCCH